ncbi:hypothetical protein UFOVP580_26 [uncultured Caudovirales phage]|uniref:Uncharacterized protein n=1 Tax=uncultured Caudovirales phage TaxID=2100421 RepID=A0A6J5PHU2_9CAUD|nr:hypothetical protein UFOVP580_26 [uncultured Caudovirales phage]
MKSILFTLVAMVTLLAIAAIFVPSFKAALISATKAVGHRLNDAIFLLQVRTGTVMPLVTLLRPYGGYQAGQSVGFTGSTEAALVASGQATNATTVTAGPLTTNQPAGVCAVVAGQGSVVITNPLITPQARVWAVISQATADTTATHVTRVVTVAGSMTIFVNANATANTQIDWSIGYSGSLSNPN